MPPNPLEIRELWLLSALDMVRAHLLRTSNSVVPETVRVSCGFPGGRGGGLKAIGQCWPASASADGHTEMFVSPLIADPSEVLAILIHEACHAADGNKNGHKAPFKRIAVAAGLEGKMTSIVASATLSETLQDWLSDLGTYPHATLSMTGRKKQSTRLVKCQCGACGYVVRTTQKWIDASGAPYCPNEDCCTDNDDGPMRRMTIAGQDGEGDDS